MFRSWGARAALLAAVAVSLAACSMSNTVSENKKASASGTEAVPLEAGQTIVLDIQSGVGKITLRAGNNPEVKVDYVKTAYADTDANAAAELAEMTLTVTRQEDRVVIDARQKTHTKDSRTNQVDLVISVPQTIGLNLKHSVGDVRIEGVTVLAPGQISVDVGDLALKNVAAPDGLQVKTSTGTIVMEELQAVNGLSVVSSVGDVRFAGEIGGTGDYRFSVDVGSLTLSLPKQTAATLDAATEVGEIRVEGLSVQDRRQTKDGVKASLRGMLGDGGAALTLRVKTGAITLKQG